MTRRTALALLAACAGCDALRVHPYAVPQHEDQRDRTRKALERLARIEPADVFVFAVIGDTQRWQDEVPGAIASINADPEVRFVLHVGDITEYGLAREYVWQNEYYDDLRVPILTAIGNHDLLGNGKAIYESVYGPRDYSFLFGRVRFVALDSNGREYGFSGRIPDIDWLERELFPDATWDRAVVFSHVPPGHGDFDPALNRPYEEALERWGNVILSLHGHDHVFRDEVVGDGPVRLVVAENAGSRKWVRITVGPEGVLEVREVAY